MSYRVAINGFGRIGRNYIRCLLERGLLERGVTVVGVNDLWDAGTLAYLLENDTTFGRLRDLSERGVGRDHGGPAVQGTAGRDGVQGGGVHGLVSATPSDASAETATTGRLITASTVSRTSSSRVIPGGIALASSGSASTLRCPEATDQGWTARPLGTGR